MTKTTIVACPRCNSEKVYRDGWRLLSDGSRAQRWLCRVCGLRFSEPNKKVDIATKPTKLFNPGPDLPQNMVTCRNFSSEISLDGFSLFSCEDVGTQPIKHQANWDRKQLNSFCHYNSDRQVGASKIEAKNLDTATETNTETVAGKSPQQELKGKIVEFSFWMMNEGYSVATIESRIRLLKRLMRLGANFNDENSVKHIIAQENWSMSRKVNAVDAYDSLLKMQGKTWTPPIYRRVRKLPFIPTEMEIDQLIAGCSNRVATFLQLLKETGVRCGEACQLLKWTDIDVEQRSIRITPEKGSNPRILPISAKLVDMLNALPKNSSTVFGDSNLMRRNYNKQRKRIVFKLKNPRISQITFHTFRHWKETMEYHKTRDILHVREILGHKSINNTMLYTQLVNFKNDDFTAAIAHCEDEACKLIEAGFEFVCDFNGNKLFKKRK